MACPVLMGDDAEAERLIADLLVRAGILMEDISVDAISKLPKAPADRDERIRAITYGGVAIGALTLAAWCLSQRMRSNDNSWTIKHQ